MVLGSSPVGPVSFLLSECHRLSRSWSFLASLLFPHVPSASLSAGKAHKLQEAHLSEFVRLDCQKSMEPLVDLQQPDFGGESHCDGSTRECRFTGPQYELDLLQMLAQS